MIARAWFLLSCLWATLCVVGGWGKDMNTGYYVIAFAPFAVPPVLAARFIVTGSFRKLQVYPAAQRRR
jgi:hypothetical protein